MALGCLTLATHGLRQERPSLSVYGILGSYSQENPLSFEKGKLVRGFAWPAVARAVEAGALSPTCKPQPPPCPHSTAT